jgi:hypothetical protein
MSGSFLAGPPREADKGGKRGIEGDFPLCESALFIRSTRRVRGNLYETRSPRFARDDIIILHFNPFRRRMEYPVSRPFSVFILSSLCST